MTFRHFIDKAARRLGPFPIRRSKRSRFCNGETVFWFLVLWIAFWWILILVWMMGMFDKD